MSVAQDVWNYLTGHGMTKAGTAGMMGNIYAESGMIPNRVETLCLQRLKEHGKIYTNATYTAFVDDGTITEEQFLHPLPGKQYGYGLCQWTTPSRKVQLYRLAKSKHVSIGNLEMQLEFLISELKTSFPFVWEVLHTTSDIREASDIVLTKFEMPKDVGFNVKQGRYHYAKSYYDTYAKEDNMSEIKTETQAIDKVLTIACAEEGYHEKASASNLDSKTANAGSNNYTKYGKEMHALQPSNMDYPAAWCDLFVDWAFYKAFGAELARKILCGNFDDYTVNSANYYKRAGRWTLTARRGYQIFFQNRNGICHTGLVLNVSEGRVYTIEGNKDNQVKKMSYALNDGYIAGYGMPRYELAVGTTSTTPTTSTAPTPSHKYTGKCTPTAYQLIKGDYGSAVKVLQTLLNLKGYKGKGGNALAVDGQFGVNTEYAVTQLQKQAGMTNINFGTVSTLTWNVLLS